MLSVLCVGDWMEPAQPGYFSYQSFKFLDFKKAWWNATFFWLILCRYNAQDHHELPHTEWVRVFLSLLPIGGKWRELCRELLAKLPSEGEWLQYVIF